MTWGADRKVARQVQALAVTNPQGVPLYVRPEAGSAAELSCIVRSPMSSPVKESSTSGAVSS